jgi:hypothetical protein
LLALMLQDYEGAYLAQQNFENDGQINWNMQIM